MNLVPLPVVFIVTVSVLMDVRIYKQSKNAMQSGRAFVRGAWVLEYSKRADKSVEPLMGWTGSSSTSDQVRMCFDDREQAVSFAQSKGWDYDVAPEQKRRVKPRNYSDNFKYIPHEDAKTT